MGSVTIQADVPDQNLTDVLQFDENDFAWKVFAGYNFNLGSLEIRGEYEYLDIDSTDDVYMLSAGIVLYFSG